mmetsp:Transcript_16759/g.18827  ORF Transcript_16759/g.18827 Transcript_16759/m.18827 type:complete len:148 (+) Transcript_16759:54-497(+)
MQSKENMSQEEIDAAAQSTLAEKKSKVQSARDDPVEWLEIALTNPPYGCSQLSTRMEAFVMVMDLLSQLKTPDAQKKVIAGLSDNLLYILLKYIYRGWEVLASEDPEITKTQRKSVSSGTLFRLHAAIVEKLGVGSIQRLLSDKKYV